MARKLFVLSFVLVAALSFGVQARASVVAVNLGTGLPPGTMGGYTMTPFEPGTIGGESYIAHETNGNDDGTGTGGWATWGQSYTGFVHVCLTADGCAGSLSLSLTGSAEAVYFYMEPNLFQDFLMTATDSSGATMSTIINGDHGSGGVGFYETASGGPFLTSITVTSSDASGFAIGEFGLSGGSLTGTVPEGSTIALLGMGLTLIGVLRRRLQA